MPVLDLGLDALRTYTADLTEPDDLDSFWQATLATAAEHDLAVTTRPAPTPWRLVDTYDISFAGYGGTPVKAWLSVPAGTTTALPAVVQFHGYSIGRGFPHAAMPWALAGYAHLVMDNR